MAFRCDDIETLVHAYLDGELAVHDLEELEPHIAGCTGCKARVDEELQFRADLRGKLAPPRTPDLLRARVSAMLDAEDRAAVAAQRRRGIAWVLPGAASVAAAAALVLVFAMPGRGDDAAAPAPANRAATEPLATGVPQRAVPVPDLAAFGAKPRSFMQDRGRADITYDYERDHARHQFQLSIIPDAGDVRGRGQKIDLDGLELWVAPLGGGQAAITILRGSSAFVLQSDTMSRQQLMEIIEQSGESWLRFAPDSQP